MISPNKPVGRSEAVPPSDPTLWVRFKRAARDQFSTAHQGLLRLDERAMTGLRRGIEATATRLLDRPGASATTEAAADAPTRALTNAARGTFARVDRNGNGFLTYQELAHATGDASFKGKDAAAVSVLREMHNEIENLADDERGPEIIGITRADLDALDGLDSGHAVSTRARNLYVNHQWQVATTRTELFARGAESINSGAINQGRAGDCYFLASLAGLADANPEAIRRMIQDNGDGTFTVDFPGSGAVTVNAPTEAEIGSYGSGQDNGIWVSVIEKAFAELRGQRRGNFFASDYDAASGGLGRDGIRTLTGGDVDSLVIRLTPTNRMIDRIRSAQEDNRIMVGVIARRPGKDEHNGLPTGHVYTVQGYDAENGTIRIRNPWGTGGPANDGIHDLSVADFRRTIDFVSLQDK